MDTSNNSNSFLNQTIKSVVDKKVWVTPAVEIISSGNIQSGSSTSFHEGTFAAKHGGAPNSYAS